MNEWLALLPVALFLGMACLLPALPRAWAAWLTPATIVVSGLWALMRLEVGQTLDYSLMDYSLTLVAVDALGLLMLGMFHLAALAGSLFIAPSKDRLQHSALLAYFAGGIGTVLAGDWISFFIFFEIIALSGVGLVLAARNTQATAAGVRYLLFQIAAGVTILTAILIEGGRSGDWAMRPVGLDTPAGFLFLLGFGIKAGFPLLHLWLVDAYPKASLAGLAVLVAVTTKVGLFGLMTVFPGEPWLVPIGVLMALWPTGYVLAERNLRRVLAYSMMVQLGLMVVAIGVGTPLALDGVAWHIVMDVSFKMVFFMAMAVILTHLGTTDAHRLGGLAKTMPWVASAVVIAAMANIALPLTGGFMSKKMILAAIEGSSYPHALYWLMASLSVMGILYAWVRLTWRVFFQAPLEPTPTPTKLALPISQRLAFLIPISVVLLVGWLPELSQGFRPFGSDVTVFTTKTVVAQLILLGSAGLAYALLAHFGFGLPKEGVRRLWDANLVYRWLFRTLPSHLVIAGQRIQGALSSPFKTGFGWLAHPRWPLKHLGQSWPIGAMALWVAALFFVLLLLGIL